MNYTITNNEQFNSLEVMFDGKPSEEIRTALKALKFRWHGVKKCWYGYSTEEAVKAAIEGKASDNSNAAEKSNKAEKESPVNKFGVTVGDLFYTSWGYDQTNVDFFQVIKLVGKESVRVRQVDPICVHEEATSWASANRTYANTKEMLPASKFSVFINDQENGDLKRIRSYYKDGSNPEFKLSSFASAWRLEGDKIQLYESWYA